MASGFLKDKYRDPSIPKHLQQTNPYNAMNTASNLWQILSPIALREIRTVDPERVVDGISYLFAGPSYPVVA